MLGELKGERLGNSVIVGSLKGSTYFRDGSNTLMYMCRQLCSKKIHNKNNEIYVEFLSATNDIM